MENWNISPNLWRKIHQWRHCDSWRRTLAEPASSFSERSCEASISISRKEIKKCTRWCSKKQALNHHILVLAPLHTGNRFIICRILWKCNFWCVTYKLLNSWIFSNCSTQNKIKLWFPSLYIQCVVMNTYTDVADLRGSTLLLPLLKKRNLKIEVYIICHLLIILV